jgi:hypothetical protein
MPELETDLARLVAIPSISAPLYPEATHPPLLEAYDEVVRLCRDGCDSRAALRLDGTLSAP